MKELKRGLYVMDYVERERSGEFEAIGNGEAYGIIFQLTPLTAIHIQLDDGDPLQLHVHLSGLGGEASELAVRANSTNTLRIAAVGRYPLQDKFIGTTETLAYLRVALADAEDAIKRISGQAKPGSFEERQAQEVVRFHGRVSAIHKDISEALEAKQKAAQEAKDTDPGFVTPRVKSFRARPDLGPGVIEVVTE